MLRNDLLRPVAPGWVVDAPLQPPGAVSKVFGWIADPLRRGRDPKDVQAVLVAELATNFMPVVVVTGMFVSVGLFAMTALDYRVMIPLTALGAAFGCGKLVLVFFHRRRIAAVMLANARAVPWDRLHALLGVGFAASVGLLGAAIFLQHDRAIHMLATGLLFSYCSGIVARVSVRPRQASVFLLVASMPVIVAALVHRDPVHWMLAIMFTVFLAAALESVRHSHRATVRQIGLRLDMKLLAEQDPLTGLQNRLGLRQAFREIVRARRDGVMLAVHCFDLDRFKPVNDRYGHAVGDLVLKLMAQRVRNLLQDGSVAARTGGDEFVVVQFPIRQPAEAELFARRLTRAIAAPYHIGDHRIEIGVSIGSATSPPASSGLDELLGLADGALYLMKGSGGGVASSAAVAFGAAEIVE